MAGVMDTCLDIMDRPWVWGQADCCTAASDVFAALHGVDPMAPLRGQYSTRAGAGRIIAAHGGWLCMCKHMVAQAGLAPCAGKPGDIGLCRNNQGQLVVAIRTELGWIAKTKRGAARVHTEIRGWTCQKP